MTDAQKTESRVNYAFKIIGNLKHDNHLFDRTCPSCKGMYSSFERANCPKCGAVLTFITTNDSNNRAISISEGTLGICFGPKQEADDDKSIKNRKNGLHPVYRFKRFSFADDSGAMALPKDHHRMKKGAQVEITIINHQVVPSGPFNTKEYGPSVEFMALIYDDKKFGRNDTLVVLKDAQAIANNVPVNVGPDGQALPIDTSTIAGQIAAMETQIATMKAQISATPTAQATGQPATGELEATAAMDDVPFDESVTSDSDSEVDVFDGAS